MHSTNFFTSWCYRLACRGFRVNIIGLSGKRMSSKVLLTSMLRCFSTRKFSSICKSYKKEREFKNFISSAEVQLNVVKLLFPVCVCLTWIRKICISASAILRPKHCRGPKPKPRLLKYWVPVLSQRDGWYCSGRKNTLESLPIAYRPNWTKV